MSFLHARSLRLDTTSAQWGQDSGRIQECNRVIAEILTTRGRLHLDRMETEQAIADMSQAIDFDNENALAYYGRALAYQEENNVELANKDLKTASSLDPDVKGEYAAYGRIESGYRVVVVSKSGHESEDKFGHVRCSAGGFLAATRIAQKFSREGIRADDGRIIDDREITAVVQEYHLLVRDVAAVPPREYRRRLRPFECYESARFAVLAVANWLLAVYR